MNVSNAAHLDLIRLGWSGQSVARMFVDRL